MTLPFIAVGFGLLLLVWSADHFVEGSAAAARHFGMPPLLIGMIIVGFGTSLPEMVVSVLAASQGNPGIALGNAYGSNITIIALILGITALIRPIAVHSQVLRQELPSLQPRHSHHGCAYTVSIRHRLRFSWSGPHQSPRGRAAAFMLPRLHRLSYQHEFLSFFQEDNKNQRGTAVASHRPDTGGPKNPWCTINLLQALDFSAGTSTSI